MKMILFVSLLCFTFNFSKPLKCRVLPKDREDCGFVGLNRQKCEDKGCCFERSVEGPWCFYPEKNNTEKDEASEEKEEKERPERPERKERRPEKDLKAEGEEKKRPEKPERNERRPEKEGEVEGEEKERAKKRDRRERRKPEKEREAEG